MASHTRLINPQKPLIHYRRTCSLIRDVTSQESMGVRGFVHVED